MRTTIAIPSLAGVADEITKEVAADATQAMRDATITMKTALRRQVTDAGFGVRLSNTWQASTYPTSGDALNPAGYAWSNAPDIIDAFDRGATISPLNGRKFLWIPTNAVPRARGRATSQKKMTPPQVLAAFHADSFVIRKGKGGHLLAFIVEQRGLNARGLRKKVRRGRIGHGDAGELVLMFTLVPSVTMPKALDIEAAGKQGADDFVARFGRSRS
jgi:hypothetical protein